MISMESRSALVDLLELGIGIWTNLICVVVIKFSSQ